MRTMRNTMITLMFTLVPAQATWAQSSSVYHGTVRGVSRNSGYARNAGEVRDFPERSANPLLDETFIAIAPAEPRTFQIHDIITIIVLENKRFQTDAQTKTERNYEIRALLEAWLKFNDCKLGTQDFIRGNPEVNFRSESEIDNKGKLKRQDKLTYRIACKIIDVKPNGNLTLEARRRIYHDEEEIVATLTGVIRSNDVTADNTVLSSKVADLDFSASHTGAVRDGTRRGWVTRLVDLFRPF